MCYQILESRQKKTEVAKRFSLINSSVNSIWCNIIKIKSETERVNNKPKKKIGKPTHKALDEVLVKWFTQQKSLNIQVSEPNLKVIADHHVDLLDLNFNCSEVWIVHFNKLYLSFYKLVEICDESKDINKIVTYNWIERGMGCYLK